MCQFKCKYTIRLKVKGENVELGKYQVKKLVILISDKIVFKMKEFVKIRNVIL